MSDTDDKKIIYMLVTEEGVETIGKTPIEALTNYLELSDHDEDWVNQLLEGKSEISHIMSKNKKEYKEWLATAREV
jgi:hypothetical protein